MPEIEIDGKKLTAEPGQMIIQVADDAGITIPRYCYHKKLSIAANCRMCLVEVEKSSKPLPACATPITDGMKVFTQSPLAIAAQRSVMEFLLINHPLDCPICDQGGQCELQDLAMGFGTARSHYDEVKRSVSNENIGPLVATQMTRCIHCTRCVRFGKEIAGVQELELIGRGENARISTFVNQALQSEVSGNIIDLCPVGALLAKPFLYKGRPWELISSPSIAPHDCLGSNINVHVRWGKVMRVVPRENEAINEAWISDRDRFSYVGLSASDRVTQPMIRRHEKWEVVDWQTALTAVVAGFEKIRTLENSTHLAALAHPSSTTEEFYLLQKLMRALGSHNLDHRLRQLDFSDDECAPLSPGFRGQVQDIERADCILLIGCHIQREVPLLGLRVRQAALKGAKVSMINHYDYACHFPLQEKIIVSPQKIPEILAGVLKNLMSSKSDYANILDQHKAYLNWIDAAMLTPAIAQITQDLLSGEKVILMVGAGAFNHQQASLLHSLIQLINHYAGAQLCLLTNGANSAGAWFAGMVPHRLPGGESSPKTGMHATEIWQDYVKGLLLLHVDPLQDCVSGFNIQNSLREKDFIVAVTPFLSGSLRQHAHVVLPSVPFTENVGSYINLEGRWQSFAAAVKPEGESRPAWKILRVLGDFFHLSEFDYEHCGEVTEEIKGFIKNNPINDQGSLYIPHDFDSESSGITLITDWSIYGVDHLVRRSRPLQESLAYEPNMLRIHPSLANALNLTTGDKVYLKQNQQLGEQQIQVDTRVPIQCAYVQLGREQQVFIEHPSLSIQIEKVI